MNKEDQRVVRTWKVKGKGGAGHDIPSHEFFIKNNCISCGWSFVDFPKRNEIVTLEDYKMFWEKHQSNLRNSEGKIKKWSNQGIHQLFDNIKKGDFVWTRSNGTYYVAEIPDTPEKLFHFDVSSEAAKYDCSAQLKDIKWKKIGKEDSVPGSISTYTQNRASIIKVDNTEESIEKNDILYTYTSLFSGLATKRFSEIHFNNKNMFFKFIGYSALEDLVALWLYDKFNYVTIPSTNKMSTQKYEFVLVDGSKDMQGHYLNNKKVYIQVKNGNTLLDSKDYCDLLKSQNEEVWLVTIYGEIDGNSKKKIACYFYDDSDICEETYKVDELLDFALDPLKADLLPDSIKRWTRFFI